MKLRLQALAAAGTLVFLVAFCTSIAVAQVQPSPASSSQPSNTPKKNPTTTSSVGKAAPECKGGISADTVSGNHSAGTVSGNHDVFLTWNANPPSQKLVGYCVFRRTKAHIPPHISDCGDCEQLNKVPVKKTGCVDTKAPDNVTYYYVVTAIYDSGMSPASNEATPVKKTPPAGLLPCQ